MPFLEMDLFLSAFAGNSIGAAGQVIYALDRNLTGMT